MALLDDLAKAVSDAFKGLLLSGVIRQIAYPSSGALDSFGDPVDGLAVETACEGFVEGYSDYYRATAGIPDNDVKVNLFAQSMPGITPGKDDTVMLGATWYQIRKVQTDPATAMWTCQAFIIPEPV